MTFMPPMIRAGRPPSARARRIGTRLGLLASVLLAATVQALAGPVSEITSASGVKAWLVEEHRVPIVALRMTFEGGATQDPSGQAGLASLLADAMTEAAGTFDSNALKDRIARIGLQLSLGAGRDAIYGGLEVVSGQLAPAAAILRAVLTEPHLEAEDIERLKAQRMAALARNLANPATVATQQWYAAAFPEHPYGNPVSGRADTIARIDRAGLQAQHRRLFARDNLKVVLVGDIGRDAASKFLDAAFGGLPVQASLTPVASAVPLTRPATAIADKPAALSAAVFGLPGIGVADPDYPALRVLNQLMGSGDLDSVLMDEIRVKRGLAYSADTRLANDRLAALVIGRFSTRNGKMKEALGVLRDVLQRIAREGPTKAQFENARSFLVGSALVDTDTSAKLASALLDVWRDGESSEALLARSERVRAVTIADVKRVAARVLALDKLIVSIAGDPS